MAAIRRLGPGDEVILAALARDEADFELEGRSASRAPVRGADAAAYLADEGVLHWVAEEGGYVVGHLLCYLERRRAGDPVQVFVYEIGVRRERRLEGVGTALLAELERWIAAAGVRSAWVLADAEVEAFYAACGFTRDEPQPVQMSRRF